MSAEAVERVGAKMSKKFNIEFTKKFRMGLTHKLTSPQAKSRRKRDHKLKVQALVRSQQAQGSGNRGTSVQAGPGHKQPV